MSLADKIFTCFKGAKRFTLKEAYEKYSDKPTETIRARIYENLGVKFKRIAKDIYCTVESENEKCIVIEGDGRDLSIIEDNSIDCIFTDHPWLDTKSNKGGTRAFAVYDCFRYTLEDFKEKAKNTQDIMIFSKGKAGNMRIDTKRTAQTGELTYEGEAVLDSFAGSGAVGKAALNLKRNCILIEILKENIQKIKKRFENNILMQTVVEW